MADPGRSSATGCAKCSRPAGFRGYNLVITFISFVSYFMLAAISFTVSIFYVVWKEEFGTGSGVTSWVGSVHFAVVQFTAPLSGYLTDRFGFRPIIMLGGLVTTCGLAATAFVTSFPTLLLTFSFGAGFGIGLFYIPGLTIVAYLEENEGRVLANGIASAGFGVGLFIAPYVWQLAIEAYHWRGGMFICATFPLQLVAVGALAMRSPSEWTKMKKAEKQADSSKWTKCLKYTKCKNTSTTLYIMQYSLYSFGLSVLFVHITALTASMTSASRGDASIPVSLIGLANIFGRIGSGILGQSPRVDTFLFYFVCTALAGASAFLVPLARLYEVILVWSVCFGLLASPANSLYGIILIYLTGIADLNTAFAQMTIMNTFGMIAGAPLAGLVYEYTGDYGNSFYLGGGVIFFGVLLLTWPYIQHRREQRLNKSLVLNKERKARSFGSMVGSQYLVVGTPEVIQRKLLKEMNSDMKTNDALLPQDAAASNV